MDYIALLKSSCAGLESLYVCYFNRIRTHDAARRAASTVMIDYFRLGTNDRDHQSLYSRASLAIDFGTQILTPLGFRIEIAGQSIASFSNN